MNFDINYLAVIVAAIVSIIVGTLWYSQAMFGKTWMKLSGITDKKIAEVKKKGMAGVYIGMIVTTLLTVATLAVFLKSLAITSIGAGIGVAFAAWVGFFAPVTAAGVLYEGKPCKLFVIQATHYLVMLIICAIILVAWM